MTKSTRSAAPYLAVAVCALLALAPAATPARAAETLHRQGRQLHFEPGADSGRVRVEVRDMDGNVLRRLPLGDVFDVAQTGSV